jgi:nitric oxide reductase NorQ protein
MLVVSYNPGYQNLLKGMKPSTRQRFVSMRFDFPAPAREAAIVARESGCDAAIAEKLVVIGNSLRALKDIDLEEVPSTRLLVYAAMLMGSGVAPLEACRAALIEALTDDTETAAALLEIVAASFGT